MDIFNIAVSSSMRISCVPLVRGRLIRQGADPVHHLCHENPDTNWKTPDADAAFLPLLQNQRAPMMGEVIATYGECLALTTLVDGNA